jgi:hypothetical protein
MEEQYIKLETAVFLKENGFEIECNKYHTNSNGIYFSPTQSLVQKWLRDVHNINIFMSFKPNIKKWDYIPYNMDMNGKEYLHHNSNYLKINSDRRFDTYEEALESAIVESLKMIIKI